MGVSAAPAQTRLEPVTFADGAFRGWWGPCRRSALLSSPRLATASGSLVFFRCLAPMPLATRLSGRIPNYLIRYRRTASARFWDRSTL